MAVGTDAGAGLSGLRYQVLSSALGITAVTAPLVAAMIIVREQLAGGPNAITLVLSGYTLCFPALWLLKPRLRPRTQGASYLGLMLVMVFAIQLRGGVSAGVSAIILVFVMLSGILFGTRGMLLGLVATMSMYALAGFAVVGGYVPPPSLAMWDPDLAGVWVRSGVVLTLFGSAAALAVMFVVTRLEHEAALLRQALAREHEQRAALERAEQERERAQEAVASAQRVEAIGRLASGVAHDFNNTLTVILAAAELARRSPGLSERVRSSLQDISEACRHAAELTRNLLTLGRRDAPQPRVVDVGELVQSFAGAARRVLPGDIELCVRASPGARAWIDRTQLERALLNLVVNARDAIERAGNIDVDIGVEPAGNANPPVPAGNYVVIRVRDDGKGMDAEVRGHLFEPFYTTKAAGHGTGMGLALVHSIVTDADGHVRLDSAPGRGTTVTLYLPLVATSAQAPSAQRDAPTLATGARSGGRSILVVEDDPGVRASIVQLLRDAGFAVEQAADGTSAIGLLCDPSHAIDLLFIDAVIPGASSAEVIETARTRRAGIGIIVCSGYVEEELLRRGIRTGEIACVRKPFTSAELLGTVRLELGLESASASA